MIRSHVLFWSCYKQVEFGFFKWENTRKPMTVFKTATESVFALFPRCWENVEVIDKELTPASFIPG